MSKNIRMFEAITELPDALVQEAVQTGLKRPRRKWYIAGAAALLAVALALSSLLPGGSALSAYALYTPDYPEMARHASYEQEKAYEAWQTGIRNQRRPGYQNGLDHFLESSLAPVLLSGEAGENAVCSPLNLFMALSLLAETTAGESRDQVLALLGMDSLEQLRDKADDLWNANYRDDGVTASVLASSLWLSEDLTYREDTLQTLADRYYASSFRGDMADPEYSAALRAWLNEQTGGLLEQQSADIELDPRTVLAIASTIRFRDKWAGQFQESKTADQVFHSPAGDQTVPFMHKTAQSHYYWTEQFGAVKLQLESLGGVWLMLPDEGITPEQILQSGAVTDFLLAKEAERSSKYLKVDLALPRFDVTSSLDLEAALQDLGLTAVFDPVQADFSAVTPEPAYLSQVRQDARVTVDEEGITAVAYTVMVAPGAGMPPEERIRFTLDRPFVFAVTNREGLPLFVGIVNMP